MILASFTCAVLIRYTEKACVRFLGVLWWCGCDAADVCRCHRRPNTIHYACSDGVEVVLMSMPVAIHRRINRIWIRSWHSKELHCQEAYHTLRHKAWCNKYKCNRTHSIFKQTFTCELLITAVCIMSIHHFIKYVSEQPYICVSGVYQVLRVCVGIWQATVVKGMLLLSMHFSLQLSSVSHVNQWFL